MKKISKLRNMVKHRLPDMARSYVKKNETVHQIARVLADIYRGWGLKAIEQELVLELSKAAHADGPIIVGPWISEVGFEVLYWVPFIRHYLTEFRIDPNRVTVLSRGGAGLWYQGCYQRYIEIFDLVTAQEFKEGNDSRIQQTKLQKQTVVTEFEIELIRKAGLTDELKKGFWLHPRYMYRLFMGYWWGLRPPLVVDNYTYHEFRPRPELPQGIGLKPGDFVAVKFYFNDSLPDNASNRVFISNILRKMARVHKVVILNTGLVVDDHSEHRFEGENIVNLSETIKLRENLDFQTRILANSKLFLGTYGGFSYIAPYYGVPSITFYSEENGFSKKHLDAANAAFQNIRDPMNIPGSDKHNALNYGPVFMPVDVNKFNIVEKSLFS